MKNATKKKILIVGGTGLIGKRIISLLSKDKFHICVLSRNPQESKDFTAYKWDINKGYIDDRAFENLTHIINLAGAGIADKKWSKSRKQEIIQSRTQNNKLIAKYLEQHKIRLEAYVAASAIGIYGDQGDRELTVDCGARDDGFLSYTTQLWEKAIDGVSPYTDRLVKFRIGIVMSTLGGALQKMLLGSKLGSAAYFGDGNAYYAWIHIDDVSNLFVKALNDKSYDGTYNAVNPNPAKVKEIAKAIQSNAKLNIVHSVPAFALKLALGEMSEMLLNSAKVTPNRLLALGFPFQFVELATAIADLKAKKI